MVEGKTICWIGWQNARAKNVDKTCIVIYSFKFIGTTKGDIMAETNRPSGLAADLGAYLGPGTKINGKLHFDGQATIDGEIEGEIVAQGGKVGVMNGAPAMVLAKCGKGLVLGLSPHAERTPSLNKIIPHAIHWLCEHEAPRFRYRRRHDAKFGDRRWRDPRGSCFDEEERRPSPAAAPRTQKRKRVVSLLIPRITTPPFAPLR